MRRKPPTPPSLATKVQHWRHQLWHLPEEESQVRLAEELEWTARSSRKAADLLLPVFVEALSHPAVLVRQGAARMLAALGDQAGDLHGVLWEQLQQDDLYMRGCALITLARSGAQHLVPSVMQVLHEDHRWSVYAALQALRVLNVAPEPFLNRLRELFQHPERADVGVFPLGPRENATTRGTVRRMLLVALSELPTTFQVLLPAVLDCARFPEELYWVTEVLIHWQADPNLMREKLLRHLHSGDEIARRSALDALVDLRLTVKEESKHLLLDWAMESTHHDQTVLACALWWCAGERQQSTRMAVDLFEQGLHRAVGWPFRYHKVLELLSDLGELTPERLERLIIHMQKMHQDRGRPDGPMLLFLLKKMGNTALILSEVKRLLETGDQLYWAIQCLKRLGTDARPLLEVLQIMLEKDEPLIHDARQVIPMLRLWEEAWVRSELAALVKGLQVEQE